MPATHTDDRPSRRRYLCGALALAQAVLLASIATLCMSCYHFSHQQNPTLARLQSGSHYPPPLDPEPPQHIGHRGVPQPATNGDHRIGNSAVAIQAAIDAGRDWIEIDLRRSRDGHIVLFHDRDLDRRSTGSGPIADHTLAELADLRLHTAPPQPIPTLDAIFQRYHQPGRRWVFDIKSRDLRDQLVPWLDRQIDAGRLDRADIILFGSAPVLADYRDAGYTLGYTALFAKARNRLDGLFRPGAIVRRAETLGAHYLVLPIILADDSLVARARRRGLAVWVYGSDDPRDYAYLRAIGVSGVILDGPAAPASTPKAE